eukprot:TRINITY_DN17306_c0_g2_i2.p2 TRINITY_DN17306_c0_g2~~TRINITY_DN17306_c0_g2_i2.p2  ORF type:complete len:249 (-),score=35.25 TRINITY_DN17306_c0_g2_i2:96-842(-)
MAVMNGCVEHAPDDEAVKQLVENSMNAVRVKSASSQSADSAVQEPMVFQTCLLCAAFFLKDFFHYGFAVFVPLLSAREHVVAKPATELMLISLVGVLGCFLSMLLMHNISFRLAHNLTACACVFACPLLMTRLVGETSAIWVGVFVLKLCFPTLQMTTFSFPNEVYPTCWKGRGYSMVASTGRVAAILAPMVVGFSESLFLMALLALLALAVVCVGVLPTRADGAGTKGSSDEESLRTAEARVNYGAI